jgi:hypothetical protein
MTTTNARIDGSLYVRMPRVNALSVLSLTRAILIALPKSPPGGVKHAAKAMRADAVALQGAHAEARKPANLAPQRTSREVDNEADALHGAIKRRLGDYQLVAAHEPDLAARAAALSEALYPAKEPSITQGDVYTQWQRTEAWFGLLAEEGRDATLRALIGGVYLDALRATHIEYGETIGTTKPRPEAPAKVDVATLFTALLGSMQDLALQLVAVANDGSASDELRAAARAALRPIDTLRESNTRRTARRTPADPVDPADPADPADPMPDVT